MARTDNRIPVTVLSGFLGSGKTTLLNHLLHDPRLTDTAVIVNEFGEVGLDHLLVESAFDEMVLMDNGCLCCSVRGDLVDTLRDLRRRASAGEIPAFARVMVETTGLADPGPIAQTLATDEDVAKEFSLHGIVVTLDAVNGVSTLDAYEEARAQVAMADLLVLTKSDLARSTGGARSASRDINPHAPIIAAENGALDPEAILSLDPERPALTTAERATGDAGHVHDEHAHDEHGHHAHGQGHIQTATVFFDGAVGWDLLSGWLDWMTALRGPDILRIKGIVEVVEFSAPVLIHGVQHVFYPPRILGGWPDADERGRIIVIARDVPATAIRASFARYREWRRQAV